MGKRTIAVVFPRWHDRHGDRGGHHSSNMFDRLARRFTDVSALVEVDSPGTILMDARGPSRYFGGDTEVARRLWAMCDQIGEPVGVGIAGSRFAALAAAQVSVGRLAPWVVGPDRTQEFIDGLPTRLLSSVAHLDDDVVELLWRLGLVECGRIRALGEAALIDRFGSTGEAVFRLVSGRDVRLFAGDVPASDLGITHESEVPLVSVGEVVSAVGPMVEAMIARLSAKGQQCVRLSIRCDTDHDESTTRVWVESRGFGVGGVLDRVASQIEGWLADGFDGAHDRVRSVVRVRIVPLECRGQMANQAVLWGGHEENIERAARAIAQVRALEGNPSVTVPCWVGGRDITTAYVRVDVDTVDIDDTKGALARVGENGGVTGDWSGSLPPPWPAWVATEPETVMVQDIDDVLVGVTGRHVFTSPPAFLVRGTRRHRIVEVAGPWPVEERWWDRRRARRHVRAQFLVEMPDGCMRVFLAVLEHNTWKLVARYD